MVGYGGNAGNDGCMNYIGDVSGCGSDVKMSADLKLHSHKNAAMQGGIRFITHNNDRSYYTLYTTAWGSGSFFAKVENGTVIDTVQVAPKGGVGLGNWNTYTLEKSGSDIIYSITDKNTHLVRASGKYTDAAPFDPAKLDETYQLAVLDSDGFYAFDNFELSTSNYYLNGKEPTNVMYADLANGAAPAYDSEYKYYSYTFENSVPIRRVITNGLVTAAPVSVYVADSPADAEWTKIGELSADGGVLNTTTVQYGKCVIFIDDNGGEFTLSGAKVLSDADLSKVYQVNETADLTLYPHIGGADRFLDNSVWSVSDAHVIKADGGVIKAAGFGKATATATDGTNAVVVSVEANKTVSNTYKEDFEGYENMPDPLRFSPQRMVGDWMMSSVYKAYNDTSKIQSLYAGGSMVFAAGGSGGMVGSSNLDLTVDPNKDIIFKTDMMYGAWNDEIGGIRMCVGNNESTYYQLAMHAWENSVPRFLKVVGGKAEYSIDGAISSDFHATTWTTLTMRRSGNNISWSIVQRDNGAELFSGTYYDPTPLTTGDKLTITCFGQGDPLIYFDNMTAGNIDSYVDLNEEAASIMYVNASQNKPIFTAAENAGALNDGKTDAAFTFDGSDVVIDTQNSLALRKIIAEDLTGTVEVYVSNTGSDYYYLTALDGSKSTDGVLEVINSITPMPVRYIKLVSSDASVKELKIYGEADGTLSVRKNSALYFVPRIDSFDSDAAVWTYSAENAVSVDGGKLTPAAVTAAPVTVTATDTGTAVSASVNVINEYDYVKNENGSIAVNLGTGYFKDGAKFIAADYNADGTLLAVCEIELPYANSNVDAMELTVNPAQGSAKTGIFCWDGGYAGTKPLFGGIKIAD